MQGGSQGLTAHRVIFNPDHYRGDVLGHVGNPGAVTPNLVCTTARPSAALLQ